MIVHIAEIADGRTVSKCSERAQPGQPGHSLTLDSRKADCGECLRLDVRLVIPGTLADAITGGICSRCGVQCIDDVDCEINRQLAADGVAPESYWNTVPA